MLTIAVQMLERRVSALEQGTLVRQEVGVRGKTLMDIEREAIIEALKAAHGRQNLAAGMLGISARAIGYKIRNLKLEPFCHLTFTKRQGGKS